MRRTLSLFLLVIVAPSLPAQVTGVTEDSIVAANLRLYEIWVRELMVYYHQPAVSIGIVHDRDLVWSEGFGYRNLERELPATSETIYRIASITKTFTATAIMQLRDAGKLRLDDPLKKHLPWVAYHDTFPGAPPITIENLLTHTSGLPREADLPYWTDRVFPTREEMIEALESQVSVFEPATRYKYSNLGLALAGEVVAAVSGEPYAEYIQDHILSPLGMRSTAVRTEDIDRERLATGYLVRQPGSDQAIAKETDSRALTPAANMSSNVEDLARFVSLQFRTGAEVDSPVLKASTLREMHRVHWLGEDWSSGRGLGFSVWRRGSRTLVGHGGWVAGYRTQIAFDPDAKIGVIVLTNSDENGPGAYVAEAFELLVPAIERAIAEEKPQVTVENPRRYLGTFHDPSGWLTDVLPFGGGLVMYPHSYPPSTSPQDDLVELTPVAEHTFRMSGENGNGELVVFEMKPDGNVARVKVGANYIFPEGCGSIDEELRCTAGDGR